MAKGNKTHIAIDPGVKTGVCIKYYNGQIELKTVSFWQLCGKKIGSIFDVLDVSKSYGVEIIAYMEDPNYNKPTFYRKGMSHLQLRRISQNVGANKRDAQLIAEAIEQRGYVLIRKRPIKGVLNKIDSERLARYGIIGRSSQHSRDAAAILISEGIISIDKQAD